MRIEGKSPKDNAARFADLRSEVGSAFPTGEARLTAIRKRWAKECGEEYKPRLPALGEPIEVTPPSEEDKAEDQAAARTKRGRGLGRARIADS